MNLKKLEEIVRDQKNSFEQREFGLKRVYDWKKVLCTKQIVVLSRIRRCGKSTLLRQIAWKLKSYFYLNFDDERL
jgi:uncharacterized protein